MSDDAGLDVGRRIDARLAAMFRQLCRKELLDEQQTEQLVGQALSRPAATRPHSGRTPAPALAREPCRKTPAARTAINRGLGTLLQMGIKAPHVPHSPELAGVSGTQSGPDGERR